MNPSFLISCAALAWCCLLSVWGGLFRIKGVAGGAFILSILSLGLESVLVELSRDSIEPDQVRRLHVASMVLLSLGPIGWVGFSLCFARGNPREEVIRWRWVLIALAALPVVFWSGRSAAVGAHSFDPVVFRAGILILNWPGILVHLTVVVASVMALTNLERTFRASVGTMRWRIKYSVLGLGLLFGVRLYSSSQVVMYSAIPSWVHSLNTGALLLACLLVTLSLGRAAGGGVDIYPSKGAIYGSISVALAGIYLFVVGILFKLAVMFGGDELLPVKSFLILAALVATAAFILSDRLRLVTRRFISRQFNRPVHDYRKVWLLFATRTSACRDVPSLSREAVRLVSDTLESLSVSLWVLDRREGLISLGASTSLTEEQASTLVTEVQVRELIDASAGWREPFTLDSNKDAWTRIQCLNPSQFQSGGGQVCVSLISQQEPVGLLLVGDRVGGVRFTFEDLDLLKCLGEQVAGSLLNLRLSSEVIRGKELEAFQLMAAFFVHDLKNTASSLSLMLQNLPAQFENPAFREDALKVVGKAVTRIGELINRLTSLRGQSAAQMREASLTAVAEAAVASLGPLTRIRLVKSLDPVPPARMDPDQIQKVVVNLVLNAQDASQPGGEVEIRTEAHRGFAVLSVRDTGIGMTPDFIRQSLFRPFQTTKRNGMGIGMFHCKTIVEAHRGRIEVSSEPGKGTIFRVWLPA